MRNGSSILHERRRLAAAARAAGGRTGHSPSSRPAVVTTAGTSGSNKDFKIQTIAMEGLD